MSNVNEQMLQSGFAAGGMKQDPVSGNEVPVGALPHEVRDDVDAKLSEGEFVVPANIVRFIGLDRLMKMRDKAIEGLKRMESMGQIGNSDEAKANGEDPLGKFDEDEEDDDGFEAEIDDIMGESKNGEVEMATGGSVPSASPYYNLLGQDTNNQYWGDLMKIQNAKRVANIGEGRGLRDQIKRAAEKLGYTGQLYGQSGPQDLTQLAQSLGISNEQLESMKANAGGAWRKDGDTTKRDMMLTELLRSDYNDKQILDWLTSQGYSVDTVDTGREMVQQLKGPGGEMVAVDASNYINDNKAVDRLGMAGAAIIGGLAAYGGVGGAGAETAATEGVKYLDPALAGTKPVVTTPGLTATDIGFGSIGPSGGFTAGLGGTTPLPTLPGSGEVFNSVGDKLLDKAKDTVIKEGIKEVLPSPSKPSTGGSIPPWLIGAGIGAGLGAATGGGSSSAAPAPQTQIPRGNNPVVDYRPAGDQMEELFINNRPTGKKKKKGFAAGGDVNLDAYNFFNQQD